MNDVSRSPSNSGLYDESERPKALRLGLPALLVAILGLITLYYAQQSKTKLEQRYLNLAEDVGKQKAKLVRKLGSEIEVIASKSPGSSLQELVAQDDPRIKEIKEITSQEKLYWKKLIDLNPSNRDYSYHFAVASFAEYPEVGFALLSALAPEDKPGYIKAHQQMAEILFSQLRGKSTLEEQRRLLALVFYHSGRSLEAEKDHIPSKRLMALSAMALGKNAEAKEALEALMKTEPAFFKSLVLINDRLEKSAENREVYRMARKRFEEMLGTDLSSDLWVSNWKGLIECYQGLGEYQQGVDRLRSEIRKQEKVVERKRHLEDELSLMLVSLQRSRMNEDYGENDLTLLKEAVELNRRNGRALQALTQIAMGKSEELAQAAKKIYDPTQDKDPPSEVLNELGIVALAKQEYELAAEYLERARRIQPGNSQTLNNLAYVYLVRENPDPGRALMLVREAIRILSANPEEAERVLTHFYDTQGVALMKLSRFEEAIASLELALKSRPNNRKILENLIECYKASNQSTKSYEERLAKLKQE